MLFQKAQKLEELCEYSQKLLVYNKRTDPHGNPVVKERQKKDRWDTHFPPTFRGNMNYTLSNEVIAHLAKILQMAILGGTDVIDHIRMINVTPSDEDDESLVLTDEYREISDNQVQKMLDEINALPVEG